MVVKAGCAANASWLFPQADMAPDLVKPQSCTKSIAIAKIAPYEKTGALT